MGIPVSTTSCANCRLADICLPYGLHSNEIDLLVNIIQNKRPMQINDTLYRQNEKCCSLFAVKSGSFRSFITNSEGEEQTIGFYLPGELIGLDALQSGHNTCTTIALETASVCELPLASLNELCVKIPSLQLQMLRILGKEIISDHDKIILLGHRSAKERLATFLLMLSRRYGALGFSNIEFNLSMRRQDIANFLGITIETVSRQFAELTKEGIISINRRGVYINKLSILQAIVEPCKTDPECLMR